MIHMGIHLNDRVMYVGSQGDTQGYILMIGSDTVGKYVRHMGLHLKNRVWYGGEVREIHGGTS